MSVNEFFYGLIISCISHASCRIGSSFTGIYAKHITNFFKLIKTLVKLHQGFTLFLKSYTREGCMILAKPCPFDGLYPGFIFCCKLIPILLPRVGVFVAKDPQHG